MNEIEKLKEKQIQLSKEVDAIKEQIEKLEKPKFEVGWYWADKLAKETKSYLGFYESKESKKGYGFGWDGEWKDNLIYTSFDKFIKATDSEVQEALTKEAIKRGFKEGVKIKSFVYGESVLNSTKPEYTDGDLIIGDCYVFKKGKWAKIVKDQPIKIGGYEVKFESGISSISKWTTIDGNIFTKEFWEAAKLISGHSKAKIMVGCSKQFDVSLETINQILEKL